MFSKGEKLGLKDSPLLEKNRTSYRQLIQAVSRTAEESSLLTRVDAQISPCTRR